MKNAIEIQNLTKVFKSHKAVDNLSLNVPAGKIYGFLGKNGAGKTTTLRMIMGLIRPNSGNILVFGKDIREDRLWAAFNIGAIVESPGFYENLSARDNLAITAQLFHTDKKRMDEVLELVQLGDTGKKKARDFSLGMKQRLGIANALIHQPKILILDEPANGLDPAGIRDMRNFLKELSEQHGITIMVSSHILSEVQILADSIGIIDQGAMIEEIDIKELQEVDQSCLVIEVDKTEQAMQLLKNMHVSYRIDDGQFKVYCKKEMNCQINRLLVQNDIGVFNLSSISQSLEERFLSATGEKSA